MHSVSQMFNLAVQYHQGGNHRQAELLYRQILQINPEFPEAFNNLGTALRNQGRLDEAITSYQQAVRLKPNFAEAHNNLGGALRIQGKLKEAIASTQLALHLKPNFAEAHNNLGNALTDQGKLDEAIENYGAAVRLSPDFAGAHNNLGNALKAQGKVDEAIASYREALRLKPNNGDAHINLGNALTDQGKLDEAITNFRAAVRLRPDFAGAHNNLGNALKAQGKVDEAIASYREALRLKPNYADAHSNLGLSLTELGRMDDAIASFQEAIRLQPKHAEALARLANLLRGKLREADRAFVEQRLTESDLNDTDRVKLLFGLAEVCDAKGEYAKAAALLRQANALSLSLRRQKGPVYHLDENARFVENLLATFTPAFFERMRGFGLETERPVFIVGFPRSGTTMTEQILAAHSQIYGAGELRLARMDFLALRMQQTNDSVFTSLPGLGGDAFHCVAQWHLDQLATMNHTAARVVDKMPSNYFYLGLLAALFPKAKFIHCRRDLRDVAVSCWMTNFRDCNWANDPQHIAARLREYLRLMEHWRKVVPISMLEVNYEETVADLPGVARRLVEWCGLDWEPACLNFNEGLRPVRTASRAQVREPVYTRSVARWRNYEREMTELFAALKPLLDGR